MNKWIDTDHVTRYLNRADRIPHRKEEERVLLEHSPDTVNRVLDIGTINNRLTSAKMPFSAGSSEICPYRGLRIALTYFKLPAQVTEPQVFVNTS